MSMPKWIGPYLQEKSVNFEVHRHEPVFTAQEVAQTEHVSGFDVAKVVVTTTERGPMLFVLPAPYLLDIETARQAFGLAHLRLSTEREMSAYFPDCEVGALPPLRHWDNVEIALDYDSFHGERLLFQAGTHEDAIVVNFNDWLRIAEPTTGHFSVDPNERGNLLRFRPWLKASAAVLVVAIAVLTGWGLASLFQFSTFGELAGNVMISSIGLVGAALILGCLSFLALACLQGVLVVLPAPFLACALWLMKTKNPLLH